MIPLRLLRAFGIWNPGEIAGFPPERAEQLVATGVAERLPPPAAAEAVQPAQPAAESPSEEPAEPAAKPADRRPRRRG